MKLFLEEFKKKKKKILEKKYIQNSDLAGWVLMKLSKYVEENLTLV